MSKRNYNVFFHTHTVSGIVISVALYIIFFAGAFALIKDEITAWEKGDSLKIEQNGNIDYDRLISSIKAEGYNLHGRDIRMIMPDAKQEIYVLLSKSQDTTIVNKPDKNYYFNINANTYKRSEYYAFYSLGELLYRLHFFSQIPTFGIYLAGFIALFFLFAIVTGVIVHWKKIISNFYVFRPKEKLKTVWTDAHTALGIIGLPFQFVFAVTSCFLCLSALVLLPANYLYNNNTKQLSEELRPMTKTYVMESEADSIPSINPFIDKALEKWETFMPAQVYIRNYGAINMKFQVDGLLDTKKKFLGNGRLVYDVLSKKLIEEKDPYKNDYLEDVELTIRRLHFGDYGGLPLKFVYLILAFITCFVIISGVLIWLEARNKKNIPASQKLYNRKVGHIYLAICLSMYPITAFTFIIAKLIPRSLDSSRQTILYSIFFLSWILLSLLFRFLRDNYKINKYSLVLGSIFALLIPIANGIASGNWFWKMYQDGQYSILSIDLFWIISGLVSALIVRKIKRPVPKIHHDTLKEEAIKEYQKNNLTTTNTIKFMRTKISILWLFLAVGYIVHHIYGLFGIYYNESLMIEGSDGVVPLNHHIWRIILEGLALLFSLLTLEVSKNWFKWTAFTWALLAGLFNVYHFIASLFYEISNISELLILLMMVVANTFLIMSINKWIKELE
ncbi:PepSY-associated TM helix domain-containing protein [Flagellimonas eckloniae]|uniref:PepSY-associated TM helix domain-containing protein n=1 Tax=Flagellimonas eckloniae TaxID=346185 RepID=A0A0Q0WXS9_9FLAO|nr:PepSY-associated TM helix domain-containing protein [Allomuricauda eckloniae]KQC30298.1 PepSY-associated TM helix domain-containing protein [Allomuricauda eckloniae]